MKKQVFLTAIILAFGILTKAQNFRSDCIDDNNPVDECVVTNPKVLNIFWSTSEANWNADAVNVLPPLFNSGRDRFISAARINAYVDALIKSSYFSELEQYLISPPELIYSYIVSGENCTNPNSVGTLGGISAPSADFFAMQDLVNCVKQQNDDDFENVNLVVLFIPPQVTPNVALGLGPCNGYHILVDNIPVVVIPLSCFDFNFSIDPISIILPTIGRELAEAMTNKDPLIQAGFVDQDPASQTRIGPLTIKREIGDVCNDRAPFLFNGRTSAYWSQEDGSCVNGFDDFTSPTINSVQMIGSGKNMKINIAGSGFGEVPHDLLSGDHQNDSSLYCEIGVGHSSTVHDFVIGHAFDPLSSGIGIRGVSWSPNLVQMNGFGGAYGSQDVILPGDNISFRISNSGNGRSAILFERVPLPNKIIHNVGNIPVSTLTTINVSGELLDVNNGRQGNVPFRLTSSAGTLSTSDLVTDNLGQFQLQFTTPETAGPITLTATFPSLNVPPDFSIIFTIDLVPVVLNIDPIYGNINGSTLITITGRGFANENTKVHFNNDPVGVSPTVNSSTEITLNAPPSASPGHVPVTVSVGGIHSRPPNDFIYFRSFSPIFSFKKGPECPQAMLTALLLRPDGSPAPNIITSIYAVEGRFISDDGSLVESISLRTNAQGIVKVRMTSVGNSNTLSIYGNSQLRSDFVHESFTLISKNMCDRMRNLHKRNLKIRFVLGGQLIPEVIDGCFVCDVPSKFHIKWRSNSPILKSLTVDGFTDDISLAKNYNITVIGFEKAYTILKENPVFNEVVGLIQFDGNVGQSSFMLNYNSVNKSEKYTLLKLDKGKWNELKSDGSSRLGIKSKLTVSGIYAIVVQS